MAASEDLINFDVIESHKENIQALPSGRSAKALASLYLPPSFGNTPPSSHTQNLNDAIRHEYEKELFSIDDSDDPLDIYDRYVKWTLNAYPSAQSTPQSQLLPLLERATKAFLSSTHYKNDPRYLKIWLHYIRFFSDAPRETFAYLARHSVGDGLALFYEEFAAWLEGAGRWSQAEEVYSLGIDKGARPAERLLRKYGEFQHRYESCPHGGDEPASPALPTVRPALVAKMDPFSIAAPSLVGAQARSRSGGAATVKPRGQKLAVFADTGVPAKPESGEGSRGWENIGLLADRRKENAIEAKPWAGETLKVGKKNTGVEKMMIFKDEEVLAIEQFPSPEPEALLGRKIREIHIHTDKVDDDPPPEHGVRGAYQVDQNEPIVSRRGSIQKIMIQNDENDENVPPSQGEIDMAKRLRREERANRTRKIKILDVKHVKKETQTVQTNLASPTGPKLKRKKSAEPTMTFHTREAMDEIYGIFNQPLKTSAEQVDEAESGDDSDDEYTSGGESTGTGRISGTTSEYGDDTRRELIVKGTADGREDPKSEGTEWSVFTASKNVPNPDQIEEGEEREEEEDDDGTSKSQSTTWEIYQDQHQDISPPSEERDELITPLEEDPQTRYVPLPPEDYEHPTGPYRNPTFVAQNRLPFMTPIVEKTESSLGTATARTEKDYFSAKTPCRQGSEETSVISETEDVELWSSPFPDADVKTASDVAKVPQPLLTKITKGPLAPKTVKAKPTSKETVPRGPIIKETICNPVDEQTRLTILDNIQPPLSQYDGYYKQGSRDYGKSVEIRKFTKAMAKVAKNGNEKTATNLAMPPILRFQGTDKKYTVKRELGKGAYAPVYLVEGASAEEEECDDEPARMGKGRFGLKRNRLEAIKMEDPPSAWEFYIMRQAKRRLGVSRAAESVIHAYEMHIFHDEGYLIEEFRDQGTLLDLVNIARADINGGGVMDEQVAMFFAVELLRTMEALHAKGLIHGDLKADNVLVRFDAPPSDITWSAQYARDGTNGWAAKGLALIDFGRGIDMKAFEPAVQFVADWQTCEADCAEMREMRPWTFQVDYHGLAGILHSLLFGKYIDTVAERGGALGAGASKTYRLKEVFKRYWQTELWSACFDLLLNPLMHLEGEEGRKLPALKGMREVRDRMENYLERNCEKGVGLKGLIRLYLMAFPHVDVSPETNEAKYDEQIRNFILFMSNVTAQHWQDPQLLQVLDPGVNSIPYLNALNCQLTVVRGGKHPKVTEDLLHKTELFAATFDPIQLRYVGMAWERLCEQVEWITRNRLVPMSSGLPILRDLVVRLDPSGGTFVQARLEYVRLCLEFRAFRPALFVLDKDIHSFPADPLNEAELPPPCSPIQLGSGFITKNSGHAGNFTAVDIQEYYMLGAVIYMGLGNWERALTFLECVLISPTQSPGSALMLEAYRKWMLVGLIHYGYRPPPPSVSPGQTMKALQSLTKSYDGIADAFQTRNEARLVAEIQESEAFLKDDGNWPLALCVQQAFQRFAIRNLGRTYLALPLSQIAGMCDWGTDIETYLRRLIHSGFLNATVTASPNPGESAILRFGPVDDAIGMPEEQRTAALAARVSRVEDLVEHNNEVATRITLTPEHLAHVAKAKSRKDFLNPDDMDTSWDAPNTDEDMMADL
ncbi:hypothetical protein B0A49_04452 [Cryomyces minteri]|uniref:Protein kinase domain-containing protein n=1 Tax=Cryomyces minteri TaxID=331657 RepID=A0A4U0XAI0_9PEZI|nr:hypothetical protein B0A49_04452 [Cryomyces minteri]